MGCAMHAHSQPGGVVSHGRARCTGRARDAIIHFSFKLTGKSTFASIDSGINGTDMHPAPRRAAAATHKCKSGPFISATDAIYDADCVFLAARQSPLETRAGAGPGGAPAGHNQRHGQPATVTRTFAPRRVATVTLGFIAASNQRDAHAAHAPWKDFLFHYQLSFPIRVSFIFKSVSLPS